MRHRKSGKKLNRNSSHRQAMFRNMAVSLIEHEVIKTTLVKAKELRRVADQMVTLGKKNTLASRRSAAAYLMDHRSLSKLFTVLADRYEDRDGGYTRVLKSGTRYGDMANMAIIEYVDRPGEIRPARNFSYALKAQEAVEEDGEEAKE